MTIQDTTENTLHTLNKTDSDITLNQQLSQCIRNGDAVLLIENGVYQCLKLCVETESHWSNKAKQLFVLAPDAHARGITIAHIKHAKVAFIDYNEFVQLTLSFRKVVSWY